MFTKIVEPMTVLCAAQELTIPENGKLCRKVHHSDPCGVTTNNEQPPLAHLCGLDAEGQHQ